MIGNKLRASAYLLGKDPVEHADLAEGEAVQLRFGLVGEAVEGEVRMIVAAPRAPFWQAGRAYSFEVDASAFAYFPQGAP